MDILLESKLRKSMLKRVRVKVDPTQIGAQSMEMCSSYEGYVLEESDTTVKVYLLNVPSQFDSIQTVDKKHVMPAGPSIEGGRVKLISALEKRGLSKDSPEMQQIMQCDTVDFLESYLRQLGYANEKLVELYREVIFA